MKILTFGEIIWDVYPDKKCIGGAPLNFAAHAKHEGAETYLLSAVGDDDVGREALDIVCKHGIKTDFISVCKDFPTGQCTVTLSESGVPSYKIEENTAYDCISNVDGLKNAKFDAFVFGTLALRGAENRETVKKLLGGEVAREIFVDLNLRAPFYSKESILLGLEKASILKVSDEELPKVVRTVFGEDIEPEKTVEMIAERFENIRIIVLTCGSEGSAAYDMRSGEIHRCGIVKTKVVSTVGAGDSYGAAFLVNYLAGKNIPDCLKRASEVSAFVVSRAEALPDFD